MANIRIKDQTTDTALVAGDYVIVDNETEGTRKFDLGQKLTDIKQDLEDLQTEIEGGGSGLTADLKAALDQLAQKVAYIDEDGQDYYDALHAALYPPKPATGISLNQSALSFGTLGATQQLTATVTPSDTSDSVVWASSNPSVATVSSTGLVTSVAYGSATITATAGSVSASCSVSIAQAATYSITNNLTHAVNQNTESVVVENTSYTGTITATTGYTITDSDISVTMGGNALTGVVSSGVISIPAVTGDVVISAVGTLKGTNLMTEVNTSNWVTGSNLQIVSASENDFTTKNLQGGTGWGVNLIQKNLQVATSELQGKTLFCEFDIDDISGSTADTDRIAVYLCGFDRASPSSGNQRKGSIGVNANSGTVGHYSLEIPVSETNIELSSSYYYGIIIYFLGPANYQVSIKNFVYTYY